jgi:hypothetical protein
VNVLTVEGIIGSDGSVQPGRDARLASILASGAEDERLALSFALVSVPGLNRIFSMAAVAPR